MERKLIIYLSVILLTMMVSCSSQPVEPQPAQADAGKDYTVLNNDTTWTVVDEMPVFDGGDSALLSYLAKNARYPEKAKKAGIEGKCIIRFCVTAEGNVTQTSILKGVDPDLDAEALRVVSSLPKFDYPAVKNGKPAAVWYVVPLQFKLN